MPGQARPVVVLGERPQAAKLGPRHNDPATKYMGQLGPWPRLKRPLPLAWHGVTSMLLPWHGALNIIFKL